MKKSKLSADNFKKILKLDGSTPEPAIRSGNTGQRIPCFDSCFDNIDVQSTSPWAPKVVRKCESKHWFSCGVDGESCGRLVGRSVNGDVITKFCGIVRFN